jgi:hypothetical protein
MKGRASLRDSDRTVASLLAAVILLLPPLVRAVAHLHRPSDSPTTFRLIRGFDFPEAKHGVSAPGGHVLQTACDCVDTDTGSRRQVIGDSQPSKLLRHYRPVDPLRGPPRAHTV